MHIRGKIIDPVALWSNYVEFPSKPNTSDMFSDLLFCPNPNHPNSKSPAFQINFKQPTVHCFAHCGIQGSYEHAIALIEGIYDKQRVTLQDIINNKKRWEPSESAEIRKSRVKVRRARSLARKEIFKVSSVRGRVVSKLTPSEQRNSGKTKNGSVVKAVNKEKLIDTYSYLPKEALLYLEERGIDYATRARWQIGYDEETKRLTIPVRDERQRLLFFIKRGIYKWQNPTYLYPPHSPKSEVLFGACNLDRPMVSSRGLILVEGSMDTMIQHQHGYRNTCGILGNSISDTQMRLIMKIMREAISTTGKRVNLVYLFFDGDAGGLQAIESARPLLSKYQVKVVRYSKKNGEGQDPAKLTKEQADRQLRKAIPLLRMIKLIREARREGVGV